MVPLAFTHNEAGVVKVEVGGALTITFWVSDAGKHAPLAGVTFNVTG
jgi:hypothetical protein